MNSFMTTPLWLSTLSPDARPGSQSAERERLRASYLSTRSNAAVLLAEFPLSVPNFTVHDISHVDALWETASLVCGDEATLTPAEAYVLGCAVILHDASMGLAAYGSVPEEVLGERGWRDLISVALARDLGRWPDESELLDPPEHITQVCLMQAVREAHAAHASVLIEKSWMSTAGNQLHLIQDTELREFYGPLIADLAASHWWDVDALAERFKRAKGSLGWQPADWIIDPLKIACILRLADATQIDSRRAPTFLFALRRPEGISRDHWRFQEHMGRPQLDGDRIRFSALRPFHPQDASAWWLALEYLRFVDNELRKVDALLHDLHRPRLSARAVAGVDSPERFSELFEVRDWRPIDAVVRISNVPGLVTTLGGEQLYGQEPKVALRELLQNAQDAIMARRVVDGDFSEGRVQVSLVEHDGAWTLEVSDDGIGMDEEVLVGALLDFGNSGWRTDQIRKKFPGLLGGGFQPRGRFGIGFFSIFMLGAAVELVTRRFDMGQSEARRLAFSGGSRERPMLTGLNEGEFVPVGTRIRVKLQTHPYDAEGIFHDVEEDRLRELIQLLVPESSVPIHSSDLNGAELSVLDPFTLADAPADLVFDRLYPPRRMGGATLEDKRVGLRTEFVRRATEMKAADGRRIGLAVLGRDLLYWSQFNLEGVVTLNGFLADQKVYFAGYLEGQANRAARASVNLLGETKDVREWIGSQEQRLRDLDLFTPSMQLENSLTFYRAQGGLADDIAIALTARGALQAGAVADWAEEHEHIFLFQVFPLVPQTRPPKMIHFRTGAPVSLPDNWILPCNYNYEKELDDATEKLRDSEYSHARYDRNPTWEKWWWRSSNSLDAIVIRKIAAAWSCSLGDLLAPIASRGWSDFSEITIAGQPTQVTGLMFDRPPR